MLEERIEYSWIHVDFDVFTRLEIEIGGVTAFVGDPGRLVGHEAFRAERRLLLLRRFRVQSIT